MDKCRVVIYDCYVPLNEQTKVKHFEKIESMEKEIQNYPEYEIIGKFFDECSATTPLNDRPEFQKVRAMGMSEEPDELTDNTHYIDENFDEDADVNYDKDYDEDYDVELDEDIDEEEGFDLSM